MTGHDDLPVAARTRRLEERLIAAGLTSDDEIDEYLTKLYAKTNENEKKTVLGVFDVEIPFSTRNSDRMLVTLAKVHYLNKATEYKLVDKRYELALKGKCGSHIELA